MSSSDSESSRTSATPPTAPPPPPLPIGYAPPISIAAAPDGVNWREELGLLIVYLLLFAVMSVLAWLFFLTVRNLLNILVAVSTIGIISVAMTMVIVSGGIDLSIGSVVAITGVIVAQLSHQVPMPIALIIAVLAGVAVGAFNGAAVTL